MKLFNWWKCGKDIVEEECVEIIEELTAEELEEEFVDNEFTKHISLEGFRGYYPIRGTTKEYKQLLFDATTSYLSTGEFTAVEGIGEPAYAIGKSLVENASEWESEYNRSLVASGYYYEVVHNHLPDEIWIASCPSFYPENLNPFTSLEAMFLWMCYRYGVVTNHESVLANKRKKLMEAYCTKEEIK